MAALLIGLNYRDHSAANRRNSEKVCASWMDTKRGFTVAHRDAGANVQRWLDAIAISYDLW